MKAHYYIEINGKPKGPFTIEDMNNLTITSESIVWKEGLPNWVVATEIEEINSLIKTSVKTTKITPPPLSVNIGNVNRTPRISRTEIIKAILKLKRKWVLAILLLTLVSYFLIAYLQGGFQAVQLYHKYKELINSPQEIARNYSLSEERQFRKEIEDRRNQTIDTNVKSPLKIFYDSISKGKSQSPALSKGFAASQQIPVTSIMSSKDLSEYRIYVDNPDPNDPNLDNKMIDALNDKIASSFGFTTISEAFVIFLVSSLILIFNSKLWKN